MDSTQYVVLCEGNVEKAICDLLIEHEILHFSLDQLIVSGGVIGLPYEKLVPHIAFDYTSDGIEKIRIYRIRDKKDHRFRIGLVHRQILRGPVDLVTRPEIEILYIISAGKYDDYTRNYIQEYKPSQYAKIILGCADIKSYQYAKRYFHDIDRLVDTINFYHRTKPGEINLWHILRSNYDENLLWDL
jgi:hypothetical protein